MLDSTEHTKQPCQEGRTALTVECAIMAPDFFATALMRASVEGEDPIEHGPLPGRHGAIVSQAGLQHEKMALGMVMTPSGVEETGIPNVTSGDGRGVGSHMVPQAQGIREWANVTAPSQGNDKDKADMDALNEAMGRIQAHCSAVFGDRPSDAAGTSNDDVSASQRRLQEFLVEHNKSIGSYAGSGKVVQTDDAAHGGENIESSGSQESGANRRAEQGKLTSSGSLPVSVTSWRPSGVGSARRASMGEESGDVAPNHFEHSMPLAESLSIEQDSKKKRPWYEEEWAKKRTGPAAASMPAAWRPPIPEPVRSVARSPASSGPPSAYWTALERNRTYGDVKKQLGLKAAGVDDEVVVPSFSPYCSLFRMCKGMTGVFCTHVLTEVLPSSFLARYVEKTYPSFASRHVDPAERLRTHASAGKFVHRVHCLSQTVKVSGDYYARLPGGRHAWRQIVTQAVDVLYRKEHAAALAGTSKGGPMVCEDIVPPSSVQFLNPHNGMNIGTVRLPGVPSAFASASGMIAPESAGVARAGAVPLGGGAAEKTWPRLVTADEMQLGAQAGRSGDVWVVVPQYDTDCHMDHGSDGDASQRPQHIARKTRVTCAANGQGNLYSVIIGRRADMGSRLGSGATDLNGGRSHVIGRVASATYPQGGRGAVAGVDQLQGPGGKVLHSMREDVRTPVLASIVVGSEECYVRRMHGVAATLLDKKIATETRKCHYLSANHPSALYSVDCNGTIREVYLDSAGRQVTSRQCIIYPEGSRCQDHRAMVALPNPDSVTPGAGSEFRGGVGVVGSTGSCRSAGTLDRACFSDDGILLCTIGRKLDDTRAGQSLSLFALHIPPAASMVDSKSGEESSSSFTDDAYGNARAHRIRAMRNLQSMGTAFCSMSALPTLQRIWPAETIRLANEWVMRTRRLVTTMQAEVTCLKTCVVYPGMYAVAVGLSDGGISGCLLPTVQSASLPYMFMERFHVNGTPVIDLMLSCALSGCVPLLGGAYRDASGASAHEQMSSDGHGAWNGGNEPNGSGPYQGDVVDIYQLYIVSASTDGSVVCGHVSDVVELSLFPVDVELDLTVECPATAFLVGATSCWNIAAFCYVQIRPKLLPIDTGSSPPSQTNTVDLSVNPEVANRGFDVISTITVVDLQRGCSLIAEHTINHQEVTDMLLQDGVLFAIAGTALHRWSFEQQCVRPTLDPVQRRQLGRRLRRKRRRAPTSIMHRSIDDGGTVSAAIVTQKVAHIDMDDGDANERNVEDVVSDEGVHDGQFVRDKGISAEELAKAPFTRRIVSEVHALSEKWAADTGRAGDKEHSTTWDDPGAVPTGWSAVHDHEAAKMEENHSQSERPQENVVNNDTVREWMSKTDEFTVVRVRRDFASRASYDRSSGDAERTLTDTAEETESAPEGHKGDTYRDADDHVTESAAGMQRREVAFLPDLPALPKSKRGSKRSAHDGHRVRADERGQARVGERDKHGQHDKYDKQCERGSRERAREEASHRKRAVRSSRGPVSASDSNPSEGEEERDDAHHQAVYRGTDDYGDDTFESQLEQSSAAARPEAGPALERRKKRKAEREKKKAPSQQLGTLIERGLSKKAGSDTHSEDANTGSLDFEDDRSTQGSDISSTSRAVSRVASGHRLGRRGSGYGELKKMEARRLRRLEKQMQGMGIVARRRAMFEIYGKTEVDSDASSASGGGEDVPGDDQFFRRGRRTTTQRRAGTRVPLPDYVEYEKDARAVRRRRRKAAEEKRAHGKRTSSKVSRSSEQVATDAALAKMERKRERVKAWRKQRICEWAVSSINSSRSLADCVVGTMVDDSSVNDPCPIVDTIHEHSTESDVKVHGIGNASTLQRPFNPYQDICAPSSATVATSLENAIEKLARVTSAFERDKASSAVVNGEAAQKAPRSAANGIEHDLKTPMTAHEDNGEDGAVAHVGDDQHQGNRYGEPSPSSISSVDVEVTRGTVESGGPVGSDLPPVSERSPNLGVQAVVEKPEVSEDDVSDTPGLPDHVQGTVMIVESSGGSVDMNENSGAPLAGDDRASPVEGVLMTAHGDGQLTLKHPTVPESTGALAQCGSAVEVPRPGAVDYAEAAKCHENSDNGNDKGAQQLSPSDSPVSGAVLDVEVEKVAQGEPEADPMACDAGERSGYSCEVLSTSCTTEDSGSSSCDDSHPRKPHRAYSRRKSSRTRHRHSGRTTERRDSTKGSRKSDARHRGNLHKKSKQHRVSKARKRHGKKEDRKHRYRHEVHSESSCSSSSYESATSCSLSSGHDNVRTKGGCQGRNASCC